MANQSGGFQAAGRHESEGKQPLDEEIPDDSVDGDREAVRALFTNHKGNVAKSLRLALGTVFFDTPFVSVYILPSQAAFDLLIQ